MPLCSHCALGCIVSLSSKIKPWNARTVAITDWIFFAGFLKDNDMLVKVHFANRLVTNAIFVIIMLPTMIIVFVISIYYLNLTIMCCITLSNTPCAPEATFVVLS
mmetsp:Transcript_9039/g.15531  ORF Transcript_9039/g.15531 Transcript_9039/m.15531 type:complete len:105 (-) Transcript_9039:1040-1354(-)